MVNFRTYQENPEEAIKQCQVLLEEAHLDTAVRVGDVYGLMIEHYARRERWKAVSFIKYCIGKLILVGNFTGTKFSNLLHE